MNLVGLVGSAVRSGRTRQAVERAIGSAMAADSGVSADIIDLAEEAVAILDGRPIEEYTDSTSRVVSRISAGDALVIASPVYRGTYTGALKNVLDHLPLEALEGKVVAMIGTGASPHHYLMLDAQLRSVLAWFDAFVLPGVVYVDNSAYSEGRLDGQRAKDALDQLGSSLVAAARRLEAASTGPPGLARQAMERSKR